MNPPELLMLIMMLLISGIGLAALMALGTAFFPNLILHTRTNLERMPIRSFLVGLVNSAFFGLICAALLAARGLPALLGLLIGVTLLLAISLGLAAIAGMAAERLGLGHLPPLRRLLAGALILELAALTPFAGWIGVPLLAGMAGYGALIIAIVRRPSSTAADSNP